MYGLSLFLSGDDGKQPAPEGQGKEGEEGGDEDHFAGELGVFVVFLGEHGHGAGCGHGSFNDADVDGQGGQGQEFEQSKEQGGQNDQAYEAVDHAPFVEEVADMNVGEDGSDDDHAQGGVAVGNGVEGGLQGCPEGNADALEQHEGDADVDGDDAGVEGRFFKRVFFTVGAGVEGDAVGPHHDSNGNHEDAGKEEAFFAKGCFGDDHAHGAGVVDDRSIFEVGAFVGVGHFFPEEFIEQDVDELDDAGQDEHDQGAAEQLAGQFHLEGADDGGWQDDVHEQSCQLGAPFLADHSKVSQDPAQGQKQKDLDLQVDHFHKFHSPLLLQ